MSVENAKTVEVYKKTASDIADGFIKESKLKGLKNLKFNILEDDSLTK